MATKNHQPSAVLRASSAPPAKPPNGLWLDISPPLGPPHAGAALGPHGGQGLWLAPGQTQTLQAQGSRRYRLGLRSKPIPTEALTPTEQPVLVLRHGADLWLSNAQAAILVLNGFFATPDNHLEIELGDLSWRLDGLATGQPMAGSDAQMMYWHGQAASWPDAFNVSTAEGGFELHKTQWQAAPVPAPEAQAAASSAATNAATVTSAEAASATSSAATLTSAEAAASSAAAEAASAASAATTQAAGTAAAATGTAASAASAAVGVGISGAAVGAVAVGVAAIAAGSSGKKTDAVVATPNTNTNTNTVTNKAPTAVALTTALTNNAIAENTSTSTGTSTTANASTGVWTIAASTLTAGTIDSQYVFSQGQGQTDLQGLAAQFDTNHDGVFNAQDALFSEFAVWQDANQNGKTDSGEVRSLADLGIQSIALQSDGVARQSAPGVHEAGRSSASASDGSSVLVGDVGFAFTSLTSVAASSASQGQINLATDTSANLLQLRLQDLLALPEQNLFSTSNTQAISGTPLVAQARQLMVTGDKTDVVKLDASTWSASNTVVAHAGHHYQVYTANTSHAQLLIDQTIVNAGHVL